VPAGRPRIISLPPNETIKLGQELVIWATEKTSEIRTSFCFFYNLKKGITYKEWKELKQKQEFRPYYEKARAALAQKLHSQALEKGLSHRYIRMYDQEMAENENQDKQDDLDRELEQKKRLIDHQASKENKNISPIQDQIDQRHEIMMLKSEITRLKANANKPETGSEFHGSNPSL
jgi:hypothetical protein